MRYRVGDVLDGYVLENECGSGAFGSVFLAKNRTLGQTCALKILYKNGRQYEKELEGLKTYQQKCRHANLMRVDHVGENEECIFYTMDAADNLHPGQKYVADTLGNRLKEKSRLSPDEIIPMLHDLLDGLNALHSAGILHRDIKPDNILWVNGHAMLGDIGLISNKLEASMAGTPGFISPRVWSNHAFPPQDDLYALAMVMYCALNGAPPENYPIPGSMSLNDSAQLIIRVYNEVLKPDSTIKTVKDFQNLFQDHPKSGNRKSLLVAAGVVLIILAGGAFWFITQPRPKTAATLPSAEKQSAEKASKTSEAITPAPAPASKAKNEKPAVPSTNGKKEKTASSPKGFCLLPGTIYELHLPPLTPLDETPEGIKRLMAEGFRIQEIYYKKRMAIRKQYPEESELSAAIPRIQQLYEAVDAAWGFKNKGTHLTLLPATKVDFRDHYEYPPLSWSEFEKRHQEKMNKSLAFLKQYSAKEQAEILYYAARKAELFFQSTPSQGIPDSFSNREAMDQNYQAWAKYHELMLKAKKNLLSLR